MTGESLEVLESRWGTREKGDGGKNSRGSKNEVERQTNWNVLFPDCKSGSLQEQRRGRRIEVYWGGGENHMVEKICSNALGVEGGKGCKKT